MYNWQSFLLAIGIPFLVQITALSAILVDVLGESFLDADWIFNPVSFKRKRPTAA